MTLIKERDRWDGSVKLLTKDCANCEFYKQIKEKELCGIGKAFKYLAQTSNPRKCEVKDRERMYNQTHNPSINYLNIAEKEELFIIKVRQLNLWMDNVVA